MGGGNASVCTYGCARVRVILGVLELFFGSFAVIQ